MDAHKDTHHVVVLDGNGVMLANREFAVTTGGYRDLLAWVTSFGPLARISLESTGSYSAGLTRYLLDAGVEVREVDTPHAHTRARKGKTDALDAEAAAREVLAGEATSRPNAQSSVQIPRG